MGSTLYGMWRFEGPMLSIKSVYALSNYTDWTIAQVQSSAQGWNGFMTFGMLYWLMPRIFQTKLWSSKLATWHFWLGTIGILAYIIPIYVAGLTQGLMWRATDSQGNLSYEFIEAITIPREPGEPDRLKVYKLSKRVDQDISAVLGAFDIRVADGKVTRARIAFGGMAGIPKRAQAMESALIGKDWSRESVEASMGRVSEDFTPLSDLRASMGYRLATAANMLMRYWLEDKGAAVSLAEVSS